LLLLLLLIGRCVLGWSALRASHPPCALSVARSLLPGWGGAELLRGACEKKSRRRLCDVCELRADRAPTRRRRKGANLGALFAWTNASKARVRESTSDEVTPKKSWTPGKLSESKATTQEKLAPRASTAPHSSVYINTNCIADAPSTLSHTHHSYVHNSTAHMAPASDCFRHQAARPLASRPA
jgi:hypothetical protein